MKSERRCAGGLVALAVLAASVALAPVLSACQSQCPRLAEPERARAESYAERGQRAFESGDREGGLRLATRALVVRLAACGYECPEVAYSFVQLGDMRRAIGQEAWALQSYRRALEILRPHSRSHAAWIAAVDRRLREK